MSKGALLSVVFIGAACTSMARPDLNAFLNRRVGSVSDLVAQAKTDRSVMDRYCRHFSMTPAEVVRYLKSLHMGKLERSDLYIVYSVPEGGVLKTHLQKLKSGTPVFISAVGTPELIVKCGNPLTKGPKKPEMPNSIAVTISTAEVIEPQVVPVEAVAVVDVEGATQPLIEPSIAAVPDIVSPTEVAIGESGTSDIPIIAQSNAVNPLAYLLLPAVGLTVRETSEPVPEPTSMAGLGLGAASLIAYRRRRAKK